MAIYYPELWKQLCFEVPEFECPMPGRLWLWIRPSESVLANLQRVCEVQVPGHRCQWNGFGCRGCSLMIYTTFQTKRPCHVFETHPLLLSSSNHIPQVLPQYVQTMESLLPCLDANQFHVKLQQICWINMLCPLDQKFLSAQGHRAWLTGWWFLVFCVSEWYGFMWLLCPFWKVAMTCGFPLEQLFRWRFCLRTFQPENGWCSYQFLHKCKGYVKNPRKAPTSLKDFSRPGPDQPLIHHHTLWFSCWNEVWAVLESQGIQCQCRMCWRSLGVGNLNYQAGQWWRSPMT